MIFCSWASWSGPCLYALKQLKKLHDRHKDDGFEVIGLNFDRDVATANRMIKTLALSYHQVFVPADTRTRRLWDEGPGLPSFPRLLLIDREGVLRCDGSLEKVEEHVGELLAKPVR